MEYRHLAGDGGKMYVYTNDRLFEDDLRVAVMVRRKIKQCGILNENVALMIQAAMRVKMRAVILPRDTAYTKDAQ